MSMSNKSEVIGWLWRRIDPTEGPGMWHHSVNSELMSLLRDRDDHDVRDLAFADDARQLAEQRAGLLEALRFLYRGYVSTLESGRDRIIFLGGECDSLEMMERTDPFLIQTRAAIANATQQRNATGGEG